MVALFQIFSARLKRIEVWIFIFFLASWLQNTSNLDRANVLEKLDIVLYMCPVRIDKQRLRWCWSSNTKVVVFGWLPWKLSFVWPINGVSLFRRTILAPQISKIIAMFQHSSFIHGGCSARNSKCEGLWNPIRATIVKHSVKHTFLWNDALVPSKSRLIDPGALLLNWFIYTVHDRYSAQLLFVHATCEESVTNRKHGASLHAVCTMLVSFLEVYLNRLLPWQGTAREELKERMQRVKTQDDVRRSMLALQRDILANLSEGSNDHNKRYWSLFAGSLFGRAVFTFLWFGMESNTCWVHRSALEFDWSRW